METIISNLITCGVILALVAALWHSQTKEIDKLELQIKDVKNEKVDKAYFIPTQKAIESDLKELKAGQKETNQRLMAIEKYLASINGHIQNDIDELNN